MALQPKSQAAPEIAFRPGELLPHLLTFTLTASVWAVIFFPEHMPSRTSLFSRVWCSVLPGLSSLLQILKQSDETTC